VALVPPRNDRQFAKTLLEVGRRQLKAIHGDGERSETRRCIHNTGIQERLPKPFSLVSGSSLANTVLPIWPVNQEEAAFSAASFALASALAAVRAARSECHAAVIYCVNRPNGSASTFVSGL
jgi:hypothetical protein